MHDCRRGSSSGGKISARELVATLAPVNNDSVPHCESDAWVGIAKSRWMFGEAITELEEQLKLEGRTEDAKRISENYQHGGLREALRVLTQISDEPSSKAYDPWGVATAYSYLGDKDQALAWVTKAIEARTSFVVYLRVDPGWDNIRFRPAFCGACESRGIASLNGMHRFACESRGAFPANSLHDNREIGSGSPGFGEFACCK